MRILVFILFILGINQVFSQRNMPPNAEIGKCYAKCLIGVTYDTFEITLPVYLGEDSNENIRREEIVVIPDKKVWKIIDGKSCLIEQPGEYLDLPVVKKKKLEKVDSTLIDWQDFTVIEESSPGGHTEWQEVVCDRDITKKLIGKVKEALRRVGYYSGPVDGEYSSQTKAALKKFQMDKGLPIGGFNVKTMHELGLSY